MRGIRGAITAAVNSKDAIVDATRRLLEQIVQRNGIATDDIAACFFTTTPDLNAEFPAAAARSLGWELVPLLCGHEMSVPGRLERCVRVLMLVNTVREQHAIEHVYLDGAAALRPDLAAARPSHERTKR